MTEISAEFPPKLIPFVFDEKSRYVVIFGGRGGGRSWSVARALLIRGVQQPLRVLCTREFMSSIADSVHKLLADQIELLGLDNFYQVEQRTIKGINGTEFRFAGIRSNFTAIKSYEGVDICWSEESELISQPSWDALIPTIRKHGSQIIVTFNPRLKEDETYQRFVVNTPPRTRRVHVNYNDNPFLTPELQEEMEYMRSVDYDRYMNIWEGQPLEYISGSIFSGQLKLAYEQNRIMRVEHNPIKKVSTSFDMGRDGTAIWFFQNEDHKRRLIDYYENVGEPASHYTQKLQEYTMKKGYKYDKHFIPHDGSKGWWGSELTIKQVLEEFLGTGSVIQLPKTLIDDRINAAKELFPNCYFDESNCKAGLQALRSYHYESNSARPYHGPESHGSDSFCYFAMASKGLPSRQTITPDMAKPQPGRVIMSSGGWMMR